MTTTFLSGLIKPQRFIRWETQRGCPFRCSFCQHRESDITMQRRLFSHSRIMEEAAWITSNPIIQDVAVLDPTFNSGTHYLSVLDALIKGGYTGKLALQCRAEMVLPEFLDRVEELNKTARVVLEIGLQTIHKNEAKLIQRPNNLNKIRGFFIEAEKCGIETEVSLIFGLPGQTLQSFIESIEFCKRLNIPTIYAFPLMLLRGTPLHELKKTLGLKEDSDINLQLDRIQTNIPHVVSSPTFSYEEWCEMARLAEGLDHYNSANNQQKMAETLRSTSFWANKRGEGGEMHANTGVDVTKVWKHRR